MSEFISQFWLIIALFIALFIVFIFAHVARAMSEDANRLSGKERRTINHDYRGKL